MERRLAAILAADVVGYSKHMEADEAKTLTVLSDLIENTIAELQDGNVDTVVAELQVLRDKLQPTYENRADYDRLVAEYAYAISDSPTLRERNDPRWANNVPESHRERAEEKKAAQ